MRHLVVFIIMPIDLKLAILARDLEIILQSYEKKIKKIW